MFVKSMSFKKRLKTVGIIAALTVLLCFQSAMAAEIGTTTEALSSNSGAGACSDDSTLGYALADAVRLAAGAQVAIVNGGDLENRVLSAGAQTTESIRAAIAGDRTVAAAELTPRELRALLESGVSHMRVDMDTSKILHEESEFGGFPQVSGISFCYDVAAPVGERILWIKLDGEGELDLEDDETRITVAATSYLFGGGYEAPETAEYTELSLTLSQALETYVAGGITTRYRSVDRMSIAGTNEDSIISHIPLGVLVMLVVLFAAGNGIRQMRKNSSDRDHDNHPDWGMY